MISISVYKQENYPIPTAKVKKKLKEVLERGRVTSDFSVSIAFVGKEKMEELVKKYYKGDPEGKYIHPILTFPTKEVKEKFVSYENDLGEIVISYDEVDSKEALLSLVEHGAMHLLGIHHEH